MTNNSNRISFYKLETKFPEEKHAQDEAMTENKNKEERKRSRARVEETSKESQAMLICSLRGHKAKKLSMEEKRKAKTGGHSKGGTDTNCLPQEHQTNTGKILRIPAGCSINFAE
ncbi:hypothetical protein E2986_13415 [Frieseomelitta varia]|uniref:Uncharacterized protein n=1 Tax=Frieseomelitta varia TaxID=561572 RepID=A0A833SIL7_9HYME|nr:hypothetical protein E2986_13415 [Frieseomelitta varia]